MSQVRRLDTLDVHDFINQYLRPRIPVVITGEVPRWPALDGWTWDYLVSRLGDRAVNVYGDWFSPTDVTTFAEFVASTIGAQRPEQSRSYVRWFARNGSGEDNWADDAFKILSADWYHPSFLPTSEYVVPFVPSGSDASAVTDPFPYRALFFSARGARTRLHLDPCASSAVLCQVVGTKRVCMYPPESHELLLGIASQQDEARLRTVEPAVDDTLAAGEVLFVPAGWWHHVDTLTDSVSITWNFVHASVADGLRQHAAEHPTDPELEVIDYMLRQHAERGHELPGRDIAERVEAAMAASGMGRLS